MRNRSGKPPDQREIEAALADQSLERQKVRVELLKTTLANDLAQYETDLANTQGRVDSARRTREDALVRSPLDGVVVQIFARQGERISPAGIVKIVDMKQLRVLADVDELHVARIKPGGKVDVTFRGNNDIYKGTIERIAPTVKRMQRVEPDGGSSTDARVVQVEIVIDDLSSMPQVLGRETRVTFL
jgi:multidrug resistance efflux pump